MAEVSTACSARLAREHLVPLDSFPSSRYRTLESENDPGNLEVRQELILRRLSILDQCFCSLKLCESSYAENIPSKNCPPLLKEGVANTAAAVPSLSSPSSRSGIRGATENPPVDRRRQTPSEIFSRSSYDGISGKQCECAELERRQEAILGRISHLDKGLGVSKQFTGGLEAQGSSRTGACVSSGFDGSATKFDEGVGERREFNGEDFDGEIQIKKQDGQFSQFRRSDAKEDADPRENEKSQQHGDVSSWQGTEQRLTSILKEAGATFEFRRVPSDYYERSFEERKGLLGAASVDHLCKSIVMVNTQAQEAVVDCSERNNSKYYVVVVQYTARLNAEKVKQFLYTLNNGNIPRKRFNMRLAPQGLSDHLTGYEHNAVTPFGMNTQIPVILSSQIAELKPEFFWLGGGEVDLKIGIKTGDFIRIVDPFVADCVY